MLLMSLVSPAFRFSRRSSLVWAFLPCAFRRLAVSLASVSAFLSLACPFTIPREVSHHLPTVTCRPPPNLVHILPILLIWFAATHEVHLHQHVHLFLSSSRLLGLVGRVWHHLRVQVLVVLTDSSAPSLPSDRFPREQHPPQIWNISRILLVSDTCTPVAL